MDRSIPLLLIGLVFGGGIGFVTAASNGVTLDGHDHSDPAHHGAGVSHDHGHSMPYDVPAGADAPGVSVQVTPDPATGWNLHVMPTAFRFAPENASRAHVPGEGHAHVYVNGAKLARLYGDWMHIGELPEGKVKIGVGLYTNDHRPIHAGGVAVADEITVTVPETP